MIVCPKADNAGVCLKSVRDVALGYLVDKFGGATVRDAVGIWRDPKTGHLHNEPVWELVSAYEPSQASHNVLQGVAQWLGEAGRQEAVYVRFASGDVEIVDTRRTAPAVAKLKLTAAE
jgi:hypothetical protein